MKEPETDSELEAALKTHGYELIDNGDSFTMRCIEGGGTTRMEADNLSDALFEAYILTNP